MKRSKFWFLIIALVTIVSCRKDDMVIPPDINPEVEVFTIVHGRVIDENENPIIEATVKMGNVETQTNFQGYFRLEKEQAADRALVYVEKEGYFNAYPVFRPRAGSQEILEVRMIEKVLSATLSATDGGLVSLNNGSEINFAAESFVYNNGDAYTGDVLVFAYYFDPTDENLTTKMPGDLTGINFDNETQGLVTYGMIDVVLETPSGQKLNIDQDATISLPVPNELISKAPQEIPLWYYNKSMGLWLEEGQATLSGDSYTGMVSHFSFWNCDQPYDFIQLEGQVSANGFFPQVEVQLTRIDNGDWVKDNTDNLGFFDGKVPQDEIFLLELINSCGTIIHSEQIGPFSSDTDLGTISVSTDDELVLIEGVLLDCDSQPLEGIVLCSSGDILITDEAGVFKNLITPCAANEVSLIGVDLVNEVQSDNLVFSVEPEINAGPIQACGNAIVSGIYFELNGGTSFFNPNCTVEYVGPFSPATSIRYNFTTIYPGTSNVNTEAKYTIVNQSGDPTELWTTGQNSFTVNGPTADAELWHISSNMAIPIILNDDTPGGVVQFRLENCDVLEQISGNSYPESTVILTGVLD